MFSAVQSLWGVVAGLLIHRWSYCVGLVGMFDVVFGNDIVFFFALLYSLAWIVPSFLVGAVLRVAPCVGILPEFFSLGWCGCFLCACLL